jgi:hypothetical protein
MAEGTRTAPILLLIGPDEHHVFDRYLGEILLTEGYNCVHTAHARPSAAELARHALVLICSGAARTIDPDTVRAYLASGGRAVVLRPPADWAPMFGLSALGETYSLVRDGYIAVNPAHPWMDAFPEPDLQCPGEMDVYTNDSAEPLAYIAGQLGYPSTRPAIALKAIGRGVGVIFTYDLAETVVLTHQGRAENASTGPNPDANGDGKFAPDDALVGMRDFRLRHVPQADMHQDLLVRVIAGLTRGVLPLPRLWHFPRSAPGLFLVDGDGDGMVWGDLEWTIRAVEEFGVKYTLYMMREQIDSFPRDAVLELKERGHDFGPHPWVRLRPSVEEWRTEVRSIVSRFRSKLGFQPTSLRSHSCIFPGWDDSPRIYAENGLRLDTSFSAGYRYVSGYLNGSALPVRFIDRNGAIIDCYEQNTVQTEDGACSPKCLLPVASEAEAIGESMRLIRQCAEAHHGVFHPYFHPRNLAGRGQVSCQRWFREVLRATREQNLLNVSTYEWLRFNDARREVSLENIAWHPAAEELRFTLRSPSAIDGLTVLLPPFSDRTAKSARLAGETVRVRKLPYEGLGWAAMEVDLASGEEKAVSVKYQAQNP